MPTLLHSPAWRNYAQVKLQSSKQDLRRQKLPGPLTPMPRIEATDLPPTQPCRRIGAREKSGLAKIPGTRIAGVLTNTEASAYGMPAEEDSDQAPQLYLLSAADYTFEKADRGELVRDHAQAGEHRFINTMPEMQRIFLACGAAIRLAVRIPAIGNLRVAPTIAKILGVHLPQAAQPPPDEVLNTEVVEKR